MMAFNPLRPTEFSMGMALSYCLKAKCAQVAYPRNRLCACIREVSVGLG